MPAGPLSFLSKEGTANKSRRAQTTADRPQAKADEGMHKQADEVSRRQTEAGGGRCAPTSDCRKEKAAPPPFTPPSQAKASRRTSLTPPQALQASHCPRSSAGVGVRWGVRGQCCARSAWWRAASSSADSPQAKADVGRRKQATAPSEGRKMGEGRHPHSDEDRRAQKMADSPRHGQRRMKADARRR